MFDLGGEGWLARLGEHLLRANDQTVEIVHLVSIGHLVELAYFHRLRGAYHEDQRDCGGSCKLRVGMANPACLSGLDGKSISHGGIWQMISSDPPGNIT
jgi:hypothetical protein